MSGLRRTWDVRFGQPAVGCEEGLRVCGRRLGATGNLVTTWRFMGLSNHS